MKKWYSWDVASSSLTRYYYAGSTRVAMRKNNIVYYLLSDHLGSTSLTTDENGQNPVKQYYLPWGEVRYTDGTLQTKYTYTGLYSNVTDFGLMYYNARWYDPYLNRWTQPDIIIPNAANPQSWDRYSYVNNNPVNYSDPSGHRACESRDGIECDPKIAHLWDRAAIILQRYGGKNDLEAMVKIINTAASLYRTYEEMIPALSGVFIGIESSNPETLIDAAFNNTGCSGMGRDPGDCPMNNDPGEFFRDQGFHEDFQDHHNQLFHFWAYVATLASSQKSPSPWNQGAGFIVGEAGNVYHEILDQDDQSTWQDYGLAVSGMETGLFVGMGLISPAHLGSYIRNDLGPSSHGGYGIVPLLINLVPLQGNR